MIIDLTEPAPIFCRQIVSTGCSICTKMKVTKVDNDENRTESRCLLGFWTGGKNWNRV